MIGLNKEKGVKRSYFLSVIIKVGDWLTLQISK